MIILREEQAPPLPRLRVSFYLFAPVSYTPINQNLKKFILNVRRAGACSRREGTDHLSLLAAGVNPRPTNPYPRFKVFEGVETFFKKFPRISQHKLTPRQIKI